MHRARHCSIVSELFDHLEPRQMLAGTPFVGTTADGDIFTVKVSGPGQVDVGNTTVDATGIDFLALTGTTDASVLSITVRRGPGGDGRISLHQISDSPLKDVKAEAVDFSGFLRLTALRNAIKFGRFTGTLEVTGMPGRTVSLSFDQLGTDGSGASVTVTGAPLALTAVAITNSDIVANLLSSFQVRGSRTIAGDFSGDLTVQNVVGVQGAKSIKVAGLVDGGTWTIPGDAGAITVGAAAGGWTLNVAGALKSLKSTIGDIVGNVTATSFGAITSKADLGGTFTATGTDAAGRSFSTFKAGHANNLTIAGPGSASTLSFIEFNGGNIELSALKSLTTTGTPGRPGDFHGAITLSGAGVTRGDTLGSLKINGTVMSSSVRVGGNAGTISAAALFSSRVLIGVQEIVTLQSASANSLSPTGGTIRSISITGPFNTDNPTLFNFLIVARRINAISSAGYLEDSNAGQLFGIVTTSIGSLSGRDDGGGRVSFRNITTQQQVTDAELDGNDFRIRII